MICLLGIGTSGTFQDFIGLPAELRLFLGQSRQLHFHIPVSAVASITDPSVVQINGSHDQQVSLDLSQPVRLAPRSTGNTDLILKLFGQVPIKRLSVRVLPAVKVIPGGQSIGVKVLSKGVLVVGHHLVATNEGFPHSPAERAGIHVGDYITRVAGHQVKRVQDIVEAAGKAGEQGVPLVITAVHDGEEREVRVQTAFDRYEKTHCLGLYIRDSAAGVGTLTFYDPQRKVYGALGHRIADVDTGQPIRLSEGRILGSDVTSIQRGQAGEPGQKRAIFLQEDQIIGNVRKNTSFGIFGDMRSAPPGTSEWNYPMPVALPEQVEEGSAKILTVVEGQKVEAFSINIEHVASQHSPAMKGMVIKVTDPRLLEKTGGIVQGMSGSPIIQKGRLVGAVTHVFVQDPVSGYGTFLEWMLQEAGLVANGETKEQPAVGPLTVPAIGCSLFSRSDVETPCT